MADNATVNLTLEASAERLLAYRIGLAINTYYLPLIVVIGVCGNFMSLLILLDRGNRSMPCYRHLIGLVFSDTLILLVGVHSWIVTVPFQLYDNLQCKINNYLFQTACMCSTMLVIFVTLHKCMAFLSPMKSNEWRTPGRAMKIVIAIAILSFLYNIPFLFMSELITPKTCGVQAYTGTMGKAFLWATLSVNSILPVIAIAFMNSMIMRALHISRKYFNDQGSDHGKGAPARISIRGGSSKGKQIRNPLSHFDKPTIKYHKQSAVLLLAVTIVFIFLTPPLFICHMIYTFIDYTTDGATYANYVLVYQVCSKLYMTNSAINFFLYMAAGTKFRKDVRRKFSGRRASSSATSSYRTTSTRIRAQTTDLQGSKSSINVLTASGSLNSLQKPGLQQASPAKVGNGC